MFARASTAPRNEGIQDATERDSHHEDPNHPALKRDLAVVAELEDHGPNREQRRQRRADGRQRQHERRQVRAAAGRLVGHVWGCHRGAGDSGATQDVGRGATELAAGDQQACVAAHPDVGQGEIGVLLFLSKVTRPSPVLEQGWRSMIIKTHILELWPFSEGWVAGSYVATLLLRSSNIRLQGSAEPDSESRNVSSTFFLIHFHDFDTGMPGVTTPAVCATPNSARGEALSRSPTPAARNLQVATYVQAHTFNAEVGRPDGCDGTGEAPRSTKSQSLRKLVDQFMLLKGF